MKFARERVNPEAIQRDLGNFWLEGVSDAQRATFLYFLALVFLPFSSPFSAFLLLFFWPMRDEERAGLSFFPRFSKTFIFYAQFILSLLPWTIDGPRCRPGIIAVCLSLILLLSALSGWLFLMASTIRNPLSFLSTYLLYSSCLCVSFVLVLSTMRMFFLDAWIVYSNIYGLVLGVFRIFVYNLLWSYHNIALSFVGFFSSLYCFFANYASSFYFSAHLSEREEVQEVWVVNRGFVIDGPDWVASSALT